MLYFRTWERKAHHHHPSSLARLMHQMPELWDAGNATWARPFVIDVFLQTHRGLPRKARVRGADKTIGGCLNLQLRILLQCRRLKCKASQADWWIWYWMISHLAKACEIQDFVPGSFPRCSESAFAAPSSIAFLAHVCRIMIGPSNDTV